MKQQLRYEEGRITMVADIHDGMYSIKSELVWVSMNIYEKYKCIKKKGGGEEHRASIHVQVVLCACVTGGNDFLWDFTKERELVQNDWTWLEQLT